MTAGAWPGLWRKGWVAPVKSSVYLYFRSAFLCVFPRCSWISTPLLTNAQSLSCSPHPFRTPNAATPLQL